MDYSSQGVSKGYSRAFVERRMRDYRGGSFAPEQPAQQFTPPPVSGKWTPQVVGQLSALSSSSAQPWMTPEVTGLIDAARQWYESGETTLPWELSGALDMLDQQYNLLGGDAPLIQPLPEGLDGSFVPPQPAPGLAQYYGMTEAEWNSLPWTKQMASRLFGTNTTAAATTGAVAGIQGGLRGMVAGAVFGTTLGSLANRYPAVGKVLEAFNAGAEGIERTLGMASLIGAATETGLGRTMRPETAETLLGRGWDVGVTLPELIANIDDAWAASSQFYRTAGIGNRAGDILNPQNWADLMRGEGELVNPTRESWQLGTTDIKTLSGAQIERPELAMVEFFDRLNAGESDIDLRDEFRERYGFGGELEEMVAEMFLDPLNVVGVGSARGIAKVGKALGASADFVRAFEQVEGPVKGLNWWKEQSRKLDFETYSQLKPFEKAMARAWNPDGTPRLLDQPTYANKISRGLNYLRELTPASRAREVLSVASHNLLMMADLAGGDWRGVVGDVRRVAANPLEAAAETGVRLYGGAEMATLKPALGRAAPLLDEIARQFDEAADLRAGLQQVSRALGQAPEAVLKRLTDTAKGDHNARVFLQQIREAAEAVPELVRRIDAGDLTPETLRQMAETFVENKIPVDDAAMLKRVYATVLDTTANWGVEYYGVRPEHWVFRLGNTIKSLQGHVLLNSPGYLFGNTADNYAKFLRDGLVLTPEANLLLPRNARRYIEDYYHSLSPTRLEESLIADLELGAGRTGADAIVSEATRPETPNIADKIGNLSAAVGSKLPTPAKLSGKVEGSARLGGTAVATKKFHDNNWRRGVGYRGMDGALESSLPPGVAQWVYGRIDAGHDFARIRESILTPGRRSVDDALAEIATARGTTLGEVRSMFEGLGLGEDLNKLNGLEPARIPEAVSEIRRKAETELSKIHREQLKARVQEAAGVQGLEGSIGAQSIFDDISLTRLEQRYKDFEGWARVYELEDFLPASEFGKLVSEQFRIDDAAYKRLNADEKAKYLGVVEQMGYTSQYGKDMALALDESAQAWADFYQFRKQELNGYFRPKGKARPEWKDVQARIDARYAEVDTALQGINARMDGMLADLLARHYGDGVRPVAEAWRSGVRTIETDLRQMVRDFRSSLNDMTPEQRRAAWPKFLDEQYKPKMSEWLAANLEGSRQVYVEAHKADVSGAVRPRSVSAETTPAQRWVEQARQILIERATGLNAEQRAVYARNLELYQRAGVSVLKNGKLDNYHLMGIVNSPKYGGTKGEYARVWDVPEDVLRSRLEKWAETHSPEIVAPESLPADLIAPEPNDVDAIALARELEQQRLEQALNGWSSDVPGHTHRAGEATPDPDPVGIAPPGTLDSLQAAPNRYDMMSAGLDETLPILHDIERSLVQPGDAQPRFGELTPEQAKQLAAYLDSTVRPDLAETKLAAGKFAELTVDHAMLNYSRRYGVDNILQLAVPYHFWYGRQVVKWAMTAVDKPAFYAQWYRAREMQEEMARPVEGLPQRLAGKMVVRLPWVPEGMSDTMYIDPGHLIFGFEQQAGQIMKPLVRDNMQYESRTGYILQEMLEEGEINEQQFKDAMTQRSGNSLYDQAMAQARAEVKSEIASPVDLAATVASPSLPVQWALERAGILQDRDMGGGIGSLPVFQFIQSMTSVIKPGGINIPAVVVEALGGDPATQQNARRNYYVMRELSNMAAEMPEQTAAIEQAMVEKNGPLYTEALRRVGHQDLARSFASILWADFFPEGEEQQRKIQKLFGEYADAGRLTEFFQEYPEYEARMSLRNADDPAAMMNVFLRSSVWDAYNGMTALEKREAVKQLDEMSDGLFTRAFLERETRNYDSITTETFAQWARALEGTVPANAPAGPQAGLSLPPAELSAAYEQYRSLPGKLAYNTMWKLPEPMRESFKLAHPEVFQYEDAKAIFLAANPDLIPYVTSEESFLAGASPEVMQEYWSYRAARAQSFPLIQRTQAEYYNLPKAERRSYLAQHPELKAYWDWNDRAKGMLSTEAWQYVTGSTGLEKLRQGDDYQEPYRPNTDAFGPDLQLALFMQAQGVRRMGSGARAQLSRAWKAEGSPMTFDAWLTMVLAEYDFAAQ